MSSLSLLAPFLMGPNWLIFPFKMVPCMFSVWIATFKMVPHTFSLDLPLFPFKMVPCMFSLDLPLSKWCHVHLALICHFSFSNWCHVHLALICHFLVSKISVGPIYGSHPIVGLLRFSQWEFGISHLLSRTGLFWHFSRTWIEIVVNSFELCLYVQTRFIYSVIVQKMLSHTHTFYGIGLCLRVKKNSLDEQRF